MTTSAATRFGSGHAVRRIEDDVLLTGHGRYADDFAPANLGRIAFLRSPYPHARIVSMDTSAAKAMPGVAAVYTGADLVAAGLKPMASGVPFPRGDGQPAATPLRHILAHERVRYVGEPVAIVIADEWQHCGLGAVLMTELLESARKNGFEEIVGEVRDAMGLGPPQA